MCVFIYNSYSVADGYIKYESLLLHCDQES